MFGDAVIILFACASLVAFAVSKNKVNESSHEDTAQHVIEDNKE